MTKESKQGLNLAIRVVATIWAAAYVISAVTFLKLDITDNPAFANPIIRGLFMFGSTLAFIIVWRATAENLRLGDRGLLSVQNGGELSNESLNRIKNDGKGSDAHVSRSESGDRYEIRFYAHDLGD
jgi:hypothetical protein